MANVYDIGQGVVESATLTVGGTLTDPTTLSFVYRTPDGAETTLTYANAQITRDSTGKYHVNLTASQFGSTTYAWISTGTDVSAISGSFMVRRQEA